MKKFKITPEGITFIRRNMLRILIPLVIVIGIAAILTGTLSADNPKIDGPFLFIFIPAVLLFLGFIFWRALRKNTATLESFQIVVDQHTITKSQDNLPDVVISRDEITEIQESPAGDMMIKTRRAQQFILISRHIENRGQLRELLLGFGSIALKDNSSGNIFYLLLILISTSGLAATFMAAENPVLIVVSGIVLILVIVTMSVLFLTSKLVEKRSKFISLVMILFIVWIIQRILPAIDLI